MRTLSLTLLTAAVVGPGAGCVTLTPVGPMAKTLGTTDPTRVTAEGARVKELTGKQAAGPLLTPAPPPTLPAMLVTPAEVSGAADAARAARRLTDELEADRKAAENMPRYAETSVVPPR